jgi:hypothetical protein
LKTHQEEHYSSVYSVAKSEEALTSLFLFEFTTVTQGMQRNGEVWAGLNLLKD